MRFRARAGLLTAGVAAAAFTAFAPALSAQTPDPASPAYFTKYVRPVLESACTHCHGAEQQKGGGRLDTLENCLKGSEGDAWLVPGKPEESKLYVSTTLPADDDLVMPPSNEPPLSVEQREHLKAWIAAGAKWPEGATLGVEPRMQFIRDIQPILEQNCVSCHRPEKLQGDLDLTTREGMLKGGENGPGLVPFDPEHSPVYTLTTLGADEDELMPPKKSGGPLAKGLIEKLRLWVKQGAPWPEGVVLVPREKTEERPPSPDNPELTAKIRDFILSTSREQAEADMKPYTETIPKTGKEFKMVVIPGGEFLMGSPESEKDRHPDEGPRVKVKIEPFWMGAMEVTWELYMPFMVTPDARWKDGTKKTLDPNAPLWDTVSSPTPPYTDMTFGMGQDGYPAISMTEHAASKFCQWLSAQTGHFYRLPTEAEWEYAARAGTSTAYFFGDDPSQLDDYAWHFDNSDGTTQPVGQKKPNPWGLYDIYGNVAEWTLDQYDPGWYGKLKAMGEPVANPFNVPTTLYPRVVRGGSWNDPVDGFEPGEKNYFRSAARRGSSEAWKILDPQLPKSLWYHTSAQWLGFRLVRPLKTPSVEEMHRYWNLGTVDNKK